MRKSYFKINYVLAFCFGIVLGLGMFVFYYGEGFSYASSDPAVCANCHAMNHQYDSWIASGHHHVATCNDCHMPSTSFNKLLAKALNGWNHSVAFTLENYHRPIQIKEYNKNILQRNCIRCHQALMEDTLLNLYKEGHSMNLCIHCHKNIGHMPIQ
ncbi:MAG: cytochrome c nitrite reductase small subunit [Bdellovibrionales bacterium RIFOXYD12_FULL_39_22]|nr:MAG: cytochrome c nitrite reductase small subunit [Bdellovibrionales bacterium RIFOXYB1_FULL_39_21]OFZ41211.1 MAG: cytochrome c nitrite reductase small subunit [Bdellovibrionales bacterium RIFOXYC12_FULL_39_17]OFZ44965.1 MAG: cytochrome c nitrite reductase small subunit [Bdellovibrionales bacterium RIFOXYC1_FULL_39_130]OFZ74412.1 MAG: cytochrome c nitrite reductase small subunit [Bdellovibrionales bacterium RIFOXYD1_FULL_39_84]OFZ77563.1 MAG: cytochrome c nitrite reductase small subunit [Bde